MCLYVLSSVLRFPHKNDVRFILTYSCLLEGSCLINVIFVCLRIVVPITKNVILCCVYVFLRLVYHMLPVSLDCPFSIASLLFCSVCFPVKFQIIWVYGDDFNNISVISWLSHKIVLSHTSPWTGFELTTLVVIGTDCTGCKSNYHTITNTVAVWGWIVIWLDYFYVLLFPWFNCPACRHVADTRGYPVIRVSLLLYRKCVSYLGSATNLAR